MKSQQQMDDIRRNKEQLSILDRLSLYSLNISEEIIKKARHRPPAQAFNSMYLTLQIDTKVKVLQIRIIQ
jgi:hypothetical protein